MARITQLMVFASLAARCALATGVHSPSVYVPSHKLARVDGLLRLGSVDIVPRQQCGDVCDADSCCPVGFFCQPLNPFDGGANCCPDDFLNCNGGRACCPLDAFCCTTFGEHECCTFDPNASDPDPGDPTPSEPPETTKNSPPPPTTKSTSSSVKLTQTSSQETITSIQVTDTPTGADTSGGADSQTQAFPTDFPSISAPVSTSNSTGPASATVSTPSSAPV